MFPQGVFKGVSARSAAAVVAAWALVLASASEARAAESGGGGSIWLLGFLWLIAFAGAVAALVFAFRFYKAMMAADEGNAEMIDIAAAVSAPMKDAHSIAL